MIDVKCNVCKETTIMRVDEESLKNRIIKDLMDVPCCKCLNTEDYIDFLYNMNNNTAESN